MDKFANDDSLHRSLERNDDGKDEEKATVTIEGESQFKKTPSNGFLERDEEGD